MSGDTTAATAGASTGAQQPRTVVLVRHGPTDWSESGRHTGWTDLSLNLNGLEQAALVAPALRRWSFSTVLCSPLVRARQSCQAAGVAAGAIFDADLREWNYGDYEGMTAAEIGERVPGWNLWDDGVANGETLGQVAERAARVVDRLHALHGDVAVFAHGHLLRVLAARWIAHPPLLARSMILNTASISTLGWEHHWPGITLWNDQSHLRTAG